MNKITRQLQKIKAEKRLGLMTHAVIGYPSLEESRCLISEMAGLGVDFIELQIPFSDPVADGPTLMRANQVALENNTKVKDAFGLMSDLSLRFQTSFIFMTYFNIIHHYGVEKFCVAARLAGGSGLIVPDMPLDEESEENFIAAAKRNNLIVIRLLSPASNKRRLVLNAKLAEGFIYYVSRRGVTGAQSELEENLSRELNAVKKIFSIPVAVGFGISKVEHIAALRDRADIAVVGSSILDYYNQGPEKDGLSSVKRFVKSLMDGLEK